MRNSFGDTITDQKSIANLLNYRFSKLGDYLGKKSVGNQSTEIIHQSNSKFEFQPISLYTCRKYLKELSVNKPLGPSNIPAWALKDCANVIVEPLCFLINAFLQEGKFPNHLKQAFITPIYKKGDMDQPDNYRPISVTSALSKIFEKVIRDQITEYMHQNNLFSSKQFGFRKNVSTTDALLYATENIRKELDDGNFVTAAFLDLSKAFDSISHEILIGKLKSLNFDTKAVSMIKSFLTGRTQRVILPTTKSNWIELYQGVPQGTVLGPLLFNIYVNSMQNEIERPTQLLQYADDTFLFAAADKAETSIKQLEASVENLLKFFQAHRLNINASKTEFIVFSKPSKNKEMEELRLKIGNHLIKPKESVKYLGIHLDRNLTYQQEVKNILHKMACGIKTIYCLRDFLQQKEKVLVLNSLVISHLHYSSILLSGISQNLVTTLEKQLNWAVKASFHRKKYESAHDLRVREKILSIRHFLDYKTIYYFWKWKSNLLPAFQDNEITTAKFNHQVRTNKLVYNSYLRSDFIRKSFFKRAVLLWNTLPQTLQNEKEPVEHMKHKIRRYFTEKFVNEFDNPQFGQKCWKDYRFK